MATVDKKPLRVEMEAARDAWRAIPSDQVEARTKAWTRVLQAKDALDAAILHNAIHDRRPALADVHAERLAQIAKWGEQHREDGTGPTYRNAADRAREACQAAESTGGANWRLVLTEEFLEALSETDPTKLRKELIQVAAVATAWIEDIDSRALWTEGES